MTIYLSGRISGLKDYGRPMFDEWAEVYRRKGYTVYSPLELDNGDYSKPYKTYLTRDLAIILNDVDAIYMLPNWTQSKGAILERLAAQTIGLPVFDAETGRQLESTLDIWEHLPGVTQRKVPAKEVKW